MGSLRDTRAAASEFGRPLADPSGYQRTLDDLTLRSHFRLVAHAPVSHVDRKIRANGIEVPNGLANIPKFRSTTRATTSTRPSQGSACCLGLRTMGQVLPVQRVEVSFAATRPVCQDEHASGVRSVGVEGAVLLRLAHGSFESFFEALPGHDVVSRNSTSVTTLGGVQ